MDMLSVSQVAEKWNMSVRSVQYLCRNGRIPGAVVFGKSWMIPADAQRPKDGRSREGRSAAKMAENQPLIRKSPFLYMTDLYNEPGSADRTIESLSAYPEAQVFLAAEIAYCRGEMDKAAANAHYFLEKHSDFYAILCGGTQLAQVALWNGDIKMWNQARKHILEAPCKDEVDRDIVSLTLAALDSSIRDTEHFPEWFARGNFEKLPRDAHPSARVYYIKYLLIFAQKIAVGMKEADEIQGRGVMRMLPYIMEPMISQMVVDKVVAAELHLRLLIAIVYRQCGDDYHAQEHLDKAIRLCLADRLYGILVENRRQLGHFLDERIALVDAEALKQVKLLHKQYNEGWTKLHNAVLDRVVQASLSNREREVARLAAFGMSDGQIATQLHLSESSVKAAIRTAKNKTGVKTRYELSMYI